MGSVPTGDRTPLSFNLSIFCSDFENFLITSTIQLVIHIYRFSQSSAKYMYYTISKIYRWFQYDKNDNLYPFWNSLTLILIVCHKKDYVTEISVLFVPKIALIRMSLKKPKSWIYIFMIQKKLNLCDILTLLYCVRLPLNRN